MANLPLIFFFSSEIKRINHYLVSLKLTQIANTPFEFFFKIFIETKNKSPQPQVPSDRRVRNDENFIP